MADESVRTRIEEEEGVSRERPSRRLNKLAEEFDRLEEEQAFERICENQGKLLKRLGAVETEVAQLREQLRGEPAKASKPAVEPKGFFFGPKADGEEKRKRGLLG